MDADFCIVPGFRLCDSFERDSVGTTPWTSQQLRLPSALTTASAPTFRGMNMTATLPPSKPPGSAAVSYAIEPPSPGTFSPNVRVGFWLWVSSTSTPSDATAVLTISLGEAMVGFQLALVFSPMPTMSLSLQDGVANPLTAVASIMADTWLHIDVIVNATPNTTMASLTVSEEGADAVLPFTSLQQTPTGVTSVALGMMPYKTAAPAGMLSFDDVVISVPPP